MKQLVKIIINCFGAHTGTEVEKGPGQRVIGNDEAWSSFSAVEASMLPSAPLHVHVHSVTKLFFNDRAFLLSLSAVTCTSFFAKTPLLSLYSVTGVWLEELSPVVCHSLVPWLHC